MEIVPESSAEINADQFAQRFRDLAGQFPSAKDLETVLQNMQLTRAPKGTRLIEYDKPCSTLYLVWDGSLSASVEDGDDKITLGQVGPGEWLGDVTLIEPGLASATVVCLEDSTLLTMSHDEFANLRDKHPTAASTLMHTLSLNLAERLRAYGKRAAQQINEHEYAMKELKPEDRENIITVLARLIGIRG